MRSRSSSPPPPRCSIETLLNLKASLIFSLRVEERGSRAVDWWADIVILDIWWCTWASSLWWLCDYPGGPRSQVESSWLLWPPTQGGRPPTFFMGVVTCHLGLHAQLVSKGKRDYKWNDDLGPIFTFNFLSFLIRRVSGIQNHQLFKDSASCGEGESKSSCFSFIADYLLWASRKSSAMSFSGCNSDTLLLMFHLFLWDGMELDVGLQGHHLAQKI